MNQRQSAPRSTALLIGAAGALALLAHTRPSEVVLSGSDPTAGLVSVCAWGLWLGTGYLLVAACAVALRHLPRCPGGAVRAVDALTPRTLRRVVDVAVGASTAAAVLAGPAAAYADAPPTPRPAATATATSTPDLDWPGVATHLSATPPSPTPPSGVGLVAAAPARAAAAPPDSLVVRAGDSLWSITARRLGPGASAARVAATWPRLYAANRAVIGSDPNLIRPGQHLAPPAPERRTTP